MTIFVIFSIGLVVGMLVVGVVAALSVGSFRLIGVCFWWIAATIRTFIENIRR